MSLRRWCLLLVLAATPLLAPAQEPAKPPPLRATLPADEPYQKTLRDYLATLTEADFTHGIVGGLKAVPGDPDPEFQYRCYVATLMHAPLIGSKRGTPAINAPPRTFLLTGLEAASGVRVPSVYPESLSSFLNWKYDGNPFYQNRALKLRVFVAATIQLLMVDDHLTQHPEAGRPDWYGYQFVYTAAGYVGCRDVLPPPVQQAFAAGVRKLAGRYMSWPIKGEEPNLDLTAPLGLWYATQAVNDPAFTKEVETYVRQYFTAPRFHPAGYFVERGGVDIAFAGMANFFAVAAALASDWPFAREAIERIYRLRAHLCLPEPDGLVIGPSHFNCRLSDDARNDQWHWDGARDAAAAQLTDEAACFAPLPPPAVLARAAATRANEFNGQISENPKKKGGGYLANDEIGTGPWSWHLWKNYNFPASVNFGFEFYRPGAYARLKKLADDQSPLLLWPFQRPGTFVRDFAGAFTVARLGDYGVVLHTGPVGDQRADDGLFQFKGPLGFGGGQLSAFWTPATGSVILGRRGGQSWNDKIFDTLPTWRLWPIHAVSGCLADGKVFTSARLVTPEVTSDLKAAGGVVRVQGPLPGELLGQGQVLVGAVAYERVFTLAATGLRVETRVKATGADQAAELVETLPVYLRDAGGQAKVTPTVIEFQVGGAWAAGTPAYQEKVTAVRLSRFTGTVQLTFDRPRRVKLSPTDWKDTFLSKATCRNVMIDLLESGDQPAALAGERSVAYTIAPVAPVAPAPAAK